MSGSPGVLPYRGVMPAIDETVFIAPGAVIIGDVRIGCGASIWFNTTVRGDVNRITIGERTNIQDNCVLHVTHETHPLVIGAQVTVGHSVTLHGCTVGDRVLVGIGAVVLDGAVVESGSMIGAGALVPPGMVVPSGTLVTGIPARVRRPLRQEEIDDLAASAARYTAYAAALRESLGG